MQFVRYLFANQVQRIPYEDLHDADALKSFCEGIYIARQNGDLLKEEKLYRRLIKIYRTPELLIRLTARVDPPADAHDEAKEAKAPAEAQPAESKSASGPRTGLRSRGAAV